MAGTSTSTKGQVDMACPTCRDVTGPAAGANTKWQCPRCNGEWTFRTCGSCRQPSHVGALLPLGGSWTCVWCATRNNRFRPRRDPNERTARDVAKTVASKGTDFAWPPPPAPPVVTWEPPEDPTAVVVTTNELAGHRITAVLGDVVGVQTLSTNMFTRDLVGLVGMVGGESKSVSKLLLNARRTARARMWNDARSLGANAIIAVRYDCSEFRDVMIEVVAYGTAVTVVADGTDVIVPALQRVEETDGDEVETVEETPA